MADKNNRRSKILYHFKGGKSQDAIAKALRCSKSEVSKVIKEYKAGVQLKALGDIKEVVAKYDTKEYNATDGIRLSLVTMIEEFISSKVNQSDLKEVITTYKYDSDGVNKTPTEETHKKTSKDIKPKDVQTLAELVVYLNNNKHAFEKGKPLSYEKELATLSKSELVDRLTKGTLMKLITEKQL